MEAFEVPVLPLVMAGVGLVLLCVASVWFVVSGFRVHWLWGVAHIFLQPVSSMLFAIVQWRQARGAVFSSLAGLALLVGAVFALPAGIITTDTLHVLMARIAQSPYAKSAEVWTLEEVRAHADALLERKRKLMQQKALVVKSDAESVEALKREIDRYNADFQSLQQQPAYAIWKLQQTQKLEEGGPGQSRSTP